MEVTPTRNCSKCREPRDVMLFQHRKDRPSGWCQPCRTAGMKALRANRGIAVRKLSRIEGDEKLCTSCDVMKSMNDFSPSTRGLGGRSAYCKACTSTRYTKSDASRRATKKYRTDNRHRWLSLHRLHQFKRRMAKEATSDGTVTDEFLEQIYSTIDCSYCGQKTSEDQRTADHVIPLARGGLHSSKNIVMACLPCNSSKSARTDIEFIGRRVI